MDEYKNLTKGIHKLKSDIMNDLSSLGYLVGIIIGIIGLIFLIKELLIIIKVSQIKKWPIVKNAGIVLNSYIEQITNRTTYSIFILTKEYPQNQYRNRIIFAYKINNNWYIGKQVSFFEPWCTNPAESQLENKLFKIGTKLDIRINPNNPAEAYILNKEYTDYFELTVGIVLSVIGIYSIINL